MSFFAEVDIADVVMFMIKFIPFGLAMTIWALVSAELETIASEKGYNQGKYFWVPFLLVLFGALLVWFDFSLLWIPFVLMIPGVVLVWALPDKKRTDRMEKILEKIDKSVSK